MGIKNVLTKIGGKVGDVIAKGGTLSPSQLKEIETNRGKYLLEFADHNPGTDEANELTNRLLAAASVEIYNAYLPQIKDLYIPLVSDAEYDRIFDSNHNIRYVNITKWVMDKNENGLEKLVNVYEVLSNEECNIALIFNRKCKKTDVYLAIVNINNDSNNNAINRYKNRIVDAIKGNFPGSEIVDEDNQGRIPFLNVDKDYSIASISNIPAEKSEKFNTQTIEKLLDGIVPEDEEKEYTLILLATPIKDIKTRKLRLGDYYSALNPYQGWQTNYTMTESKNVTSGMNVGVNLGGSVGTQASMTESHTTGKTKLGHGSVAVAAGAALSAGGSAGIGAGIGSVVGGVIGSVVPFAGTAAGAAIGTKIGAVVGPLAATIIASGVGLPMMETESDTVGTTNGTNKNMNFGANFARSSNSSAMIGKNEGITQSFVNYNIKHTLEVLEEQMKRLELSTALGLWDFAAYVLSEDVDVANNVAHSYLALTQGEKSYMSEASVNLWRGDLPDEKSNDAKEIIEYLKDLRHPIFGLNPDIIKEDSTFNVYPSTVTATTALSGKELAYSLNFPKKSVAGLPVIQCAEFGRSITTYDENNIEFDINIGKIYHMNKEENVDVNLSKKSLSSHVFVTGSTGSGKSNTVYEMLEEAIKQNVKFLVVEPTKGEYKQVFGTRKDVSVYGTNLTMSPLLKINPFSFPEGITVYEHMDRLVEIFNVCWPMYAAMPAVLKSAIEKSYIDCGWDLVESINKYDKYAKNLYPTFSDVARNIKIIINSSEYDAENKGAYKGSLLTRLESLTNGINGLVFTNDEIPLEKLFDENVIIDISRVGSNETKSLIMGMVVLKLQEYRMSKQDTMNSELKHLTVLEEAHNLLKRTSTEQPVEGGNLLGKSVEMISNAIAEMRTYGEGFIIVDQAPGLLDMAAIRNTNTKIIMRLPDENDRKLVGLAANLNDDQILELAKLPCGVAAIYQNEWIQPILCKVKRFNVSNKKYDYKYKKEEINIDVQEGVDILSILCKGTAITDEKQIIDIIEKLQMMKIDSSVQASIIEYLKNPITKPRLTKLAPIVSAFFPQMIEDIGMVYNNTYDKKRWTAVADSSLRAIINTEIDNRLSENIIQAAITYYLYNIHNDEKTLKEWRKEMSI